RWLELAVLDQGLRDRQLEQRQVHGQRGKRAVAELVAYAIVVGILRVLPGAEDLSRTRREEALALDAVMDLERLDREVRRGGERALPAERLDHEIGIDPARARRVDLALRRHAQDAEVDPLARELVLACRPRMLGVAQEVGTLLREVAAHLARERLHDTDADQRRRIARIAAAGPLAVALEERVVGLGAGAGGTAQPVTGWARDRLRSPEEATMHAAERPTRCVRRFAATQAVGEAVLMLEEKLPEVVELRDAHLAVGDPLRIERLMHRA